MKLLFEKKRREQNFVLLFQFAVRSHVPLQFAVGLLGEQPIGQILISIAQMFFVHFFEEKKRDEGFDGRKTRETRSNLFARRFDSTRSVSLVLRRIPLVFSLIRPIRRRSSPLISNIRRRFLETSFSPRRTAKAERLNSPLRLRRRYLLFQLIAFERQLVNLSVEFQPIDFVDAISSVNVMFQLEHRFFHHRRIVTADPKHLSHQQFELAQIIVTGNALDFAFAAAETFDQLN